MDCSGAVESRDREVSEGEKEKRKERTEKTKSRCRPVGRLSLLDDARIDDDFGKPRELRLHIIDDEILPPWFRVETNN